MGTGLATQSQPPKLLAGILVENPGPPNLLLHHGGVCVENTVPDFTPTLC